MKRQLKYETLLKKIKEAHQDLEQVLFTLREINKSFLNLLPDKSSKKKHGETHEEIR